MRISASVLLLAVVGLSSKEVGAVHFAYLVFIDIFVQQGAQIANAKRGGKIGGIFRGHVVLKYARA